MAAVPRAAQALDPNRNLSQYVRDRWRTEHGFPRGPVYAIEQTTDGYLWIGTEKGLVRFDGMNFVLIQSTEAGTEPMTHVIGLFADSNGGLWTRLRRTAQIRLRYRGGPFPDNMAALKTRSVVAMARDREGNPLVWVLHGEGSALVLRNGKLETIAAPKGFSRSPVLALSQTTDGSIWVGTRDAGLFRIKEGITSKIEGLPDLKVNTLVRDGNEVWVGTDAGLVRWNGSKLTSDGIPRSLEGVQILAMTLDRHSNLWLGTNSSGLLRLNAAGLARVDKPDNNPREAVTAVFEDREGNIWIGSASGLERIRDSVFVTYSSTEGLPSNRFGPIYADANATWFAPIEGGLWRLRDGRPEEVTEAGLRGDAVYSIAGGKDGLWIGRQLGGLTHLRTDGSHLEARTYRTAEGLSQNSVYSVYESRDGAVWAGTISGGVSRMQAGKFTTYTSADGLASNTVASIIEDAQGAMWFATPTGLSRFASGRWRTYKQPDGLPSENVNCLLEDSAGTLWIGTSTGLAFQKRGGHLQSPKAVPALLREQIFGIAEDASGALWVATATHVVRVKREALAIESIGDGDLREFGIPDGLRGIEGVKRHRSVVKDSRGIWFSLNEGISVVRPEYPSASSAPAVVRVQTLTVDGKSVLPHGALRIPGGSQRVVFGYAGLSLSVPERVRFRYLLEGFDREWSEPSPVREAVYTNLGPGDYRFRVIASNPDGVWNSAEATLAFEMAPLFWQAWWFRLSSVLTVAFVIAAVYRLRLLRVTEQLNVRFEERLAERTRIAQDLHDTLLQGFLSASMQLHVASDRLPDDSPVKPSMARVLSLMGRVIEEGRNALRGLRTNACEAGDLPHVFANIREELGHYDQCEFRTIVVGEPRPLHPLLRDEVYRIGREALVNSFRHSQAKLIEIEIEYAARRFRLVVRDNGCGIDERVLRSGREGHWGLRGMRERAETIGALLRVSSGPKAGTEVELVIPASIAFPGQYRDGFFGRFARHFAGDHSKVKTIGGGNG